MSTRDQAALYGNEEDVGRSVSGSRVPRDQVFITTKLWTPAYKGGDPYAWAMKQAEVSLAKLGTHADLYLLHSPHHPKARLEFWRALEDLQKSGKARGGGRVTRGGGGGLES